MHINRSPTLATAKAATPGNVGELSKYSLFHKIIKANIMMEDNQPPAQPQEQLKDIARPHAHDVLSGRGNFVNHHFGNENYRKL